MALYCPNCGQHLPDEAAFCFKCGHPVDSTSAQQIRDGSPLPGIASIGNQTTVPSPYGKNTSRHSLNSHQPITILPEPISEASAASEFTVRLESAFERLRQRYQQRYIQGEFPFEVWDSLNTHLLEARQTLESAAVEERVREFAREYLSRKITWGQLDRCIDRECDQTMATLLEQANALDPQHLLPILRER